MTAGTLRVIFELGEVSQQDGGTQFILGSYVDGIPSFAPLMLLCANRHKANFPMTAPPRRSPCRCGSGSPTR